MLAGWLLESCSAVWQCAEVELQLLYRASRDGWAARAFHSKSDNQVIACRGAWRAVVGGGCATAVHRRSGPPSLLQSRIISMPFIAWLICRARPPVSSYARLFARLTHSCSCSDCSGQGPTLTVVQTVGGYIFGGYTDQPWNTTAGYQAAYGAFLFALRCHAELPPTKMPALPGRSNDHAMCCSAKNGPAFGGRAGGGHDLHVGHA